MYLVSHTAQMTKGDCKCVHYVRMYECTPYYQGRQLDA